MSMDTQQLQKSLGKELSDKVRYIGRKSRERKLDRRKSLLYANADFDPDAPALPQALNGEGMLTVLKNREEEVKSSLPMLMFQTDDNELQIKRYISVYLLPLLTSDEILALEEDVPRYEPMVTAK